MSEGSQRIALSGPAKELLSEARFCYQKLLVAKQFFHEDDFFVEESESDLRFEFIGLLNQLVGAAMEDGAEARPLFSALCNAFPEEKGEVEKIYQSLRINYEEEETYAAPDTLQRTCAECGTNLAFDVAFCPKCGARQPELTPMELASAIAQVQQQQQVVAKRPEDTEPNFGFAALGFFIPLAGLILYAIWYKDRPGPAKSAIKGAITGILTYVAVVLLVYVVTAIVAIGIASGV